MATLATGTCLAHVAMLVQQERMAGQLQHQEAVASCRAALHTQGHTGQVRQAGSDCADDGAESGYSVGMQSIWAWKRMLWTIPRLTCCSAVTGGGTIGTAD